MLTIIAYMSLFIAIISMVFAVVATYHFYWAAALGIYIFSFIAGFSIGQITVALIFIPVVLGIAHAFKKVTSKLTALKYISYGSLLTSLIIFLEMGNYLFYPIFWIA